LQLYVEIIVTCSLHLGLFGDMYGLISLFCALSYSVLVVPVDKRVEECVVPIAVVDFGRAS
ncbi:hypothetical protein LXA62_18050, partial [Erwinia amylovora]|uniref:hypothetical protein n=1 Tax=Erwinia amylovora TaxID=552 RepID=UPI0020BDEA5C